MSSISVFLNSPKTRWQCQASLWPFEKVAMRVGRVAAQDGWGSGGAFQYQSLQRVDEDWFTNRQLLKNYLDQTSVIGARP